MNDNIFKLLLAIALTALVAALVALLVAVAQMIGGGWLGWVVALLIVMTFFIIWRKID